MWGWVDAAFLAGFAVLLLVAFLAGRAWERRAHHSQNVKGRIIPGALVQPPRRGGPHP